MQNAFLFSIVTTVDLYQKFYIPKDDHISRKIEAQEKGSYRKVISKMTREVPHG